MRRATAFFAVVFFVGGSAALYLVPSWPKRQPERLPAAVPSAGELMKEFSGLERLNASMKIKPENHRKSQDEHLAALKRVWPRGLLLEVSTLGASDTKILARLCLRNLVSACEQYYRAQRARYYSALERADSAALAGRLERVREQLSRFAKLACMNGTPFVCQDAVDETGADEDEIMVTIQSYCEDGEDGAANYCMVGGFELMNRWMEKSKSPWGVRVDLERMLEKSRAMMAKACGAGSLVSCSELVQGPIADPHDRRSRAALKVFESRCGRGDPAACVLKAAAHYKGDRRPVADAVQHYCELRARQKTGGLTDEEMSVCLRLQARIPIDESLWKDMTAMVYEGTAISMRALHHLQ